MRASSYDPYILGFAPWEISPDEYVLMLVMHSSGNFWPAEIEHMNQHEAKWISMPNQTRDPGSIFDLRILIDLGMKRPHVMSAYNGKWLEPEFATVLRTNHLLRLVPSLENIEMLQPLKFDDDIQHTPPLHFVVHRGTPTITWAHSIPRRTSIKRSWTPCTTSFRTAILKIRCCPKGRSKNIASTCTNTSVETCRWEPLGGGLKSIRHAATSTNFLDLGSVFDYAQVERL